MTDSSPLYLRMKQALQWLKQKRGLLNKDIAEKMGMTNVAFSNGMKRIQLRNDEDFVIKFHQATDEIFSLDWLLYGTGEKFTADIKKTETATAVPASTPVDTSSAINAALAAQMESIELLKSEKATLLEAHARELKVKNDLIQSLRDRLADKDRIIAEQKARLIDYRRIIDSRDDMTNYPFPIGTAEGNHREQKNL